MQRRWGKAAIRCTREDTIPRIHPRVTGAGEDSNAKTNSNYFKTSRGLEMEDTSGLDNLLDDQIDEEIDCG